MATLSKQGGRHWGNLRYPYPNFQEQAQWLPSRGSVVLSTLSRVILVGFRNRTVVVNPR